MTVDPKTLEEKMQKRVAAVCCRPDRKVIFSKGCEDTGAGVVVFEEPSFPSTGSPTITAHFFRSRQTKIPFHFESLDSAHQVVGAFNKLKSLLEQEASDRVAPHTLEIGQIVVISFGATMRSVTFYKITDIPDPRKIEMVEIPYIYKSGDYAAGSVIPENPELDPPSGAKRRIETVKMKNGCPGLKGASAIERFSAWSGKPELVYSD